MFTIAELPEYLREAFIIIIGIWYDTDQKPVMNTFLQPFCKKFITCFHEGITWTHPKTNDVCVSKIVAPLFIADAPARAQIQNIINFNGKFGCNICEIKTKCSIRFQGKKRIRVYAFQDEASLLRTGRKMEKHANKALDKKMSVKGIKGKSIVMFLPLLDLGTCVIPEYMHSVLLGVVKQFISLWINSKYSCQWSITKYIQEIDDFLTNVQPPHFFNRMPRNLSHYRFYKASEFYNFLLFYSIPTLVNRLPEMYLQHWFLLVISLFNLLEKQIPSPQLEATEVLLKLFVRDVGSLYGDRAYTYNIHQLLHLVLSVKRWGPLWATSAFPFENYNNFLANCVHGTKHLGQEMINNIRRAQAVQSLKFQYEYDKHTSNNIGQMLENYQLFNVIKTVQCKSDAEIKLIESLGLRFEDLIFYSRAKINNLIYTSQIYKTIRTNSYTVQVNINDNIVYGIIRYFLKIENNVCFILHCFSVEHTKIFIHQETNTKVKHILPIKEEDKFIFIKVRDIKFISHLIRVGNYICKRPNELKKTM